MGTRGYGKNGAGAASFVIIRTELRDAHCRSRDSSPERGLEKSTMVDFPEGAGGLKASRAGPLTLGRRLWYHIREVRMEGL